MNSSPGMTLGAAGTQEYVAAQYLDWLGRGRPSKSLPADAAAKCGARVATTLAGKGTARGSTRSQSTASHGSLIPISATIGPLL